MKNSSTGKITQSLLAQGQRLLSSLARLSIRYPWLVLLLCLGGVVWASLYTVRHLEFVASRNALISGNKRYIQLDEEYADEFVGIDQLVVVVAPLEVEQTAGTAEIVQQMAVDMEQIGIVPEMGDHVLVPDLGQQRAAGLLQGACSPLAPVTGDL